MLRLHSWQKQPSVPRRRITELVVAPHNPTSRLLACRAFDRPSTATREIRRRVYN